MNASDEGDLGGALRATIHLPVTPLDSGQITSLEFLQDGRTLAVGDGDGAIHFYDPSTTREQRPRWIARTKGSVNALCYAPGKSLLAAGSYGEVLILDVMKWKAMSTWKVPAVNGKPEGAYALAFSPDGALLAGTGFSGTIMVWDVGTGELRHTMAGPKIPPRGARTPDDPRSAPASVGDLEFTPDGATLAASSRDGVRLWEYAKGRERLRIDFEGHPAGLSISPDGAHLAVALFPRDLLAGGSDIVLCDVASGEKRLTLRVHTRGIDGVKFLAGGTRLVSLGGNRTLRLWDVVRGQQISSLPFAPKNEASAYLAVAPDGKLLATGGGGDISLVAIDGATLRPYQPTR